MSCFSTCISGEEYSIHKNGSMAYCYRATDILTSLSVTQDKKYYLQNLLDEYCSPTFQYEVSTSICILICYVVIPSPLIQLYVKWYEEAMGTDVK